eukprot:c6636_g1_i2.p1 GENE.c6636_g1_i2~~c6636_g1_i2.p1  ORF type:complete len:390 (-),score=113.80 c6636_g1_i2:874-1989(-)
MSITTESLVKEWLELDTFDAETRAEIETLWNAKEEAALQKLLGHRMEFGTAGLRARMGAGYSQMNVLTIVQTTQGFAEYLLEQFPTTARSNGVCIGFDGRHRSERFAKAAAAVFFAKGFEKVLLFSRMVMTPMVPFTTVVEGCVAGIMVTASHNPKEDNGYKVYWANGCQIIPPHDSGISDSILRNLQPIITASDIEAVDLSRLSDFTEKTVQKYMETVTHQLKADLPSQPLDVTYTAMHGVGYRFINDIFQSFGLRPVIPVLEQVQPDPEFPTVKLPNPEEGKGALKLAMQTADNHGSRFIVANDPDADRLAIAEKNPETGEWYIFKGDEIGILLADWALRNHRKAHPNENGKCECDVKYPIRGMWYPQS